MKSFLYLRPMHSDRDYMARCIQLALLGQGNVAPNPMVGAIVVHENKIIGEGYHKKYGEAHAEVNAIASVEDTSLLKESVLYVSLEPCAHFGKTPPCSDLIVKHKFKKVVIGCIDSFSEVSGRGIERMEKAGIKVITGVLEDECRALNRHFFTFHEKKRPFIFLKWAQTMNKLIDAGEHNRKVTRISSDQTRPIVHLWRAQHQAIMAGYNTVQNDNPSLTVRDIQGNNPVRIILDPRLELDQNSHVFDNKAPTIVLNNRKNTVTENISYVQTDTRDVKALLSTLHAMDIQSIMIEGGAKTLQMFIEADLWDEACIIEGNRVFESGTPAPQLEKEPSDIRIIGDDRINYYQNI